MLFQPTLPARGATVAAGKDENRRIISTHAPRTGSDGQPREPIGSKSNFNPRSPHGERQIGAVPGRKLNVFQPTLPARGATILRVCLPRNHRISTHAPRTGSDDVSDDGKIDNMIFQPTLPARGATRMQVCRAPAPTNFKPRSPHGERPAATRWSSAARYFNPRSPHGERHKACDGDADGEKFQPTLPARGATASGSGKGRKLTLFQPTLPARGATCLRLCNADYILFQPTLPARGATRLAYHTDQPKTISTHAPRTGSDTSSLCEPTRSADFNPRSPHGERRNRWQMYHNCQAFQPTLPARGATRRRGAARFRRAISTHAPRTGSDEGRKEFSPHENISTHAPRTGSDMCLQSAIERDVSISTHAPRTGSDTFERAYSRALSISTHAPRTGSD